MLFFKQEENDEIAEIQSKYERERRTRMLLEEKIRALESSSGGVGGQTTILTASAQPVVAAASAGQQAAGGRLVGGGGATAGNNNTTTATTTTTTLPVNLDKYSLDDRVEILESKYVIINSSSYHHFLSSMIMISFDHTQ